MANKKKVTIYLEQDTVKRLKMEALKADKEVIMASVKTYGQTLYYASERLRDDKEVVKTAIENKGLIIKYASLRLRSDKELAEIAIKQDKRAYLFLSKELKQDEDIKKLIDDNIYSDISAEVRLKAKL